MPKFLTPTELLEFEIVKERFTNSSEIGYFVKNLVGLVDFYRTSRTTKINANQFINFLSYIKKFSGSEIVQ